MKRQRHTIHFWQGLALAAVMTMLLPLDAHAQTKSKIEVVPQIPHTGLVTTVAFTPAGARVLSGSQDGTLKLWDVGTGRLIRTFEGANSVQSVAFSPDGARVLSGSRDGTLKLWDVGTGQLIRTFKGHAKGVTSVAFAPDGARVLSGSWDNTVKLWDAGTGRLIRTFEAASSVKSVAFSPHGARVLSGGFHKTLKLWDAGTGRLIRTFKGAGGVNSIAFSPDGARVLSGGFDKTVKLWDAGSGRLIRTFEGHADWVNSVAFSPHGARVLSGSHDKTIKLWNAGTGRLIRTFKEHADVVTSVAFAPDGARVFSGSRDRTVKLWNARSGQLIRTFAEQEKGVTSVAFSPDGARALSGGRDKTVRLWDAGTGRLIRTFKGHVDMVTSVAFSPDGTRVLSGSRDRTVKLWDAGTGRLIRTFEAASSVKSVAFSPDGARVLSGGWRGTVKLWDAGTGRLIHAFAGQAKEVNSVAFSPDGVRVLSGSSDETTVKLWNAGTGRLIRTFEGHGGWGITSVAFSPAGTRVLSVGGSTVKLWDASAGQLIHTFEGHETLVNSVAFSPDGARVLSGSQRRVKLWDTSTGQLIRTFAGSAISVNSVAFSPDSARVLSGSGDTTTRIWDVTTGQELVRMMASPKGEWLAMTAKGFFAASPKGNELLGIVRGLEVTSIEQIHQSLYNPDLVREKLAGDPDKEFEKAAKVVNLEKVLDSGQVPAITIISPKATSEAKADLIEAVATITNTSGGIGRIEWRVNGITAGVETPPKGTGKTITVKRQLALDPGENSIEVVAYNGRNLVASLPARTTIKWQGAADAGKGRLYVLAIGIDAYSDRKFRPLSLAVKDAEAFGAALETAGKGEYASVHIVPALDGDATPAKLEQLIDRMARDITPRDTFILFAAAHGTSKDGRFYLIPYGYNSDAPGTLAEKAIGQARLQDWVGNRIKARKALILLDTCESGALVGGYTKSRVDAPASEAAIGRLHEATGRPVLTAAATGTAALEGYEGHGIFTWALLDALKNGDANNNKTIELSELAAHVQGLVPKLTAEMRRRGTSEPGKRAAVTMSASEAAAPYSNYRQSARFGSRGENFVIARRLQ